MEEKFYKISEFPDYEISQSGVVRRIKNKKVSKPDKYGRVQLCCNGKRAQVYTADLMCGISLTNTTHLTTDSMTDSTEMDLRKEISKLRAEIKRLRDEGERNFLVDMEHMKWLIHRYERRYFPEYNDWERQNEREENDNIDSIRWGLFSTKYDVPIIDPDTLLPRINYLSGDYLHMCVYEQGMLKLVKGRYKDVYDYLMEESAPYRQKYKESRGGCWDSIRMIHLIGCWLWVILITDQEFRNLMCNFKINHTEECDALVKSLCGEQ